MKKKYLIFLLALASFGIKAQDHADIQEYYHYLDDLKNALADVSGILGKSYPDIKNIRKQAKNLKELKSNLLYFEGSDAEPDQVAYTIEVVNPLNGQMIGSINYNEVVDTLNNYNTKSDKAALKQFIKNIQNLVALKQFELLKTNALLKYKASGISTDNITYQADMLWSDVINNKIKNISQVDKAINSIKKELKKAIVADSTIKTSDYESFILNSINDARECFVNGCYAVGKIGRKPVARVK